MAELRMANGINYHVLSSEELRTELFLMTGKKATVASAVAEHMRTLLGEAEAGKRRLAQRKLGEACVGSCHGLAGEAERVPLPAEQQRELAHFVLTGAALTAVSGGLGMIAATGRGIQFGYAVKNTAQTMSLAARQRAYVTWVVTSDRARQVVVATSPGLMNPRVQEAVVDFSTSLFPGAPAMSLSGAAGAAVGSVANPHEFLR